MDKIEFEKLRGENRVFTVGRSFAFAVQTPDESCGCSASRCSNCDSVVAFCDDICENCNLPLVGPFGFPPYLKWKLMSPGEKRVEVEEVFCRENHGRLRCVNVPNVPLTFVEAEAVRRLPEGTARLYRSSHGIDIDAEFFCPFPKDRHTY